MSLESVIKKDGDLETERTENSSLLARSPSFIKILLVEDDSVDARILRRMLGKVGSVQFSLSHIEQLSGALRLLGEERFDVILLDLSLLDSWGLDTFARVHAQAPDMPVVVLTGLDDEALAVEAVQKGAQDYLVKGQVDGNLLVRAIRYAIERHRMQMALSSMSLIDELTGLYNRRGFLTLAGQHFKLVRRTEKGSLLLFADLDGLKQINDTLSHGEGDTALINTADLLRKTFRESDIIARLGGDEFVVLVTEVSQANSETVINSLLKSIEAYNVKENRRYNLSISVGTAYYDPERPSSIDELLSKADKLMYEQKRKKKELI